MSAAFYQNDINSFKNQNQEEILGIIVHNDEYDSGTTRQRRFYDELWDYLKKVEIEAL